MSAKADSTDDSEGNRSTKELAESLTTMWNSAAGGDLPIYNKKLHVHHVVSPSSYSNISELIFLYSNMADTPYALEISPDSTLQFTLTRGTANDGRSTVGESTPRCTMSLRHPGKTKEHLAFRVKTTQPRRYLVRPNQGVVAPGTTEKVTILLVEKDKQILLQSYDRLGQTALDHSKDKFLVQSCTTPDDFASR